MILRSRAPLFLLFPLLALSAHAQDLLTSAENNFYRAGDNTRVGIEIEYKGLTAQKSAEIAAKLLGGKVVAEESVQKTTVKRVLADGTKEYNEIRVNNYKVVGSSIGTIDFKPDLNQLSDTQTNLSMADAVTELVTEPIRMPEVNRLQILSNLLREQGAKGTDASTPVATQVNVEIAEGVREEIRAKDLVNLMRSYFRPEHRAQIIRSLKVPKNRQPYVAGLSDGFLKRLLDPNYKPTLRQLFDDYIYRQSLEFLGDRQAWTMSTQAARAKLLAAKNPIVPRVVKLNPLRMSSLMMYLFPDDPMTKQYAESGWAAARPLIEFREWNNDFAVAGPVKQALGLLTGAKQYGYYDHDKLMSSLSGMSADQIAKLRERSYRQAGKDPVIFRYFLGDPDEVDADDYKDMAKAYGDTEVGFLSAEQHGIQPVHIPGESVVYQRRPFHKYSVSGTYNPGAVNGNIQQALENKYVEAVFWNSYAPGSFPQTELLAKIAGEKAKVAEVKQALDRRHPNGWVLKGVWDLGSEKEIITDSTHMEALVATYRASDFDEFKKRVEAKWAGQATAPEYIQSELKNHPGYTGYKISKILDNPNLAIVQEKLDIDREFRVEVVGGKVLGEGSTIDRWYYTYKYGFYGNSMKDYKAPPPGTIEKIEAYTQSLLDKLPKELQGMPFGMDIVLLKDGSFRVIESNPGGNSNFLFEEEKESVEALTKYLKSYPELAKSGKVGLGMEPAEQMTWLKTKFKEWDIDTLKQYPKMSFLETRIDDPDFTRVTSYPEDYKLSVVSRTKRTQCSEILKDLLRGTGSKAY